MRPKNLDECVELARKKEPFQFNNVFALARLNHSVYPPSYTIYSYGPHYPMYVYDYEACQWIGNNTKSTPTTEKQKRKFQPHTVAHWVDTKTLQTIAAFGLVGACAKRIEEAYAT